MRTGTHAAQLGPTIAKLVRHAFTSNWSRPTMQRYYGLILIAIGIVGGWRLGASPEPAPIEEVSPETAWQLYREQAALARRCDGDIPPHPAAIALLLGAAATVLLAAASPEPGRVLATAFLGVE